MRTMPKADKRDFEKTKTVRFSAEEVERMNEVMRRVRERSQMAAENVNPNKLMKELMGLKNYDFTTLEDRQYLAAETVSAFGAELAAGFNLLQPEHQEHVVKLVRNWIRKPAISARTAASSGGKKAG